MFFHKARAESGKDMKKGVRRAKQHKKLSNFPFAYKNYIFHSNKWVRDCERWWRMGCTGLNPWIRPKKRVENHSTCANRRRERRGRFGWDEKLNEEKSREWIFLIFYSASLSSLHPHRHCRCIALFQFSAGTMKLWASFFGLMNF